MGLDIPDLGARDRGFLGRIRGQLSPHDAPFRFPDRARAAAVVAILHRRQGRWSIPFVVRRPDLRSHPGQVGLPGGGIEAGEDAWSAAVREAEEEISAPRQGLTPLGSTGTVRVTRFNFAVVTFVAHLAYDDWPFVFDPGELTGVLEVDLKDLLNRRLWKVDRTSILGRHFPASPYPIWGLTARLLEELLPRLEAAVEA